MRGCSTRRDVPISAARRSFGTMGGSVSEGAWPVGVFGVPTRREKGSGAPEPREARLADTRIYVPREDSMLARKRSTRASDLIASACRSSSAARA